MSEEIKEHTEVTLGSISFEFHFCFQLSRTLWIANNTSTKGEKYILEVWYGSNVWQSELHSRDNWISRSKFAWEFGVLLLKVCNFKGIFNILRIKFWPRERVKTSQRCFKNGYLSQWSVSYQIYYQLREQDIFWLTNGMGLTSLERS